jgi:hypothetical protein
MIFVEEKLKVYNLLQDFYDILFCIVNLLWIITFLLANPSWIINIASFFICYISSNEYNDISFKTGVSQTFINWDRVLPLCQ